MNKSKTLETYEMTNDIIELQCSMMVNFIHFPVIKQANKQTKKNNK